MTWRVSASCPACGAPIAVRQNRRDRELFIGCSGYPCCTFSEPYDAMAHALAERVHDLECRLDAALVAQPSTPADVLTKALRELIFKWHPDRHPEPIPSHEVVAELTRLRGEVEAQA